MGYEKEIIELKKENAQLRKDLRDLEKKFYNHRKSIVAHME